MRRGYPVFDPSAPLSLGVAINISSSLCLSECVCVGMCTCVEEAKAMLRAALYHLEDETFKRTRSFFLFSRHYTRPFFSFLGIIPGIFSFSRLTLGRLLFIRCLTYVYVYTHTCKYLLGDVTRGLYIELNHFHRTKLNTHATTFIELNHFHRTKLNTHVDLCIHLCVYAGMQVCMSG